MHLLYRTIIVIKQFFLNLTIVLTASAISLANLTFANVQPSTSTIEFPEYPQKEKWQNLMEEPAAGPQDINHPGQEDHQESGTEDLRMCKNRL